MYTIEHLLRSQDGTYVGARAGGDCKTSLQSPKMGQVKLISHGNKNDDILAH